MRSYRYSALAEWSNCRRKFSLQYVGKWEPNTHEINTADIGTMVHAGLEAYYTGADPVIKFNELLETVQDGPELRDAVATAQTMLDGYIDWVAQEALDLGWSSLLNEEQLEYEIFPGVMLTGKIDQLIVDSMGDVFLIDHKTVSNLSQYDNLEQNQQLLFYDFLLRKSRGITPDGAMINMLRRTKRTTRTKPPYYGRSTVRFNETQRTTFEEQLVGLVQDVMEAEQRLERGESWQAVMRPRPTSDCSWRCPFKNVCPMFDNGDYAMEYLQDNFKQRDE